MGYEALTEHKLTVNRVDAGDAKFLLAVKQGDISYEEVDNMTEEWFYKVNKVYETTTLPAHVDDDLLNEICMTIVNMSKVLDS